MASLRPAGQNSFSSSSSSSHPETVKAQIETRAMQLGREIKLYKSTKPITLFQRIVHFVKEWIKGNGKNAWISRGQVAKDLNGKFFTELKTAFYRKKDPDVVRAALEDVKSTLNQLKGIGLTKDTKKYITELEKDISYFEGNMNVTKEASKKITVSKQAANRPNIQAAKTISTDPDALD